MSKGFYQPVILKDLENDIPIFAGMNQDEGILTLILGNIKEDEIEEHKSSLEYSLRREMRGEIKISTKRNEGRPDRFDLVAVMGPYQPRHKFDTACRKLDRFMSEVLDAGPNLKDDMDEMFATKH